MAITPILAIAAPPADSQTYKNPEVSLQTYEFLSMFGCLKLRALLLQETVSSVRLRQAILKIICLPTKDFLCHLPSHAAVPAIALRSALALVLEVGNDLPAFPAKRR
ncbi:hypothetical protein [Pseudomonas sp. IT-P176]|jgi:hypothetical protein|uniref:hypothetical protein n=1 Tax=Pseudomonas sp. IT-P176 TaxID=3026444 RepID=UPI0039E02BF0